MPYDGISFTDSGFKIIPPSEMNIQAEMAAKTHAQTFIKKLDESHKVNPDSKNKKDPNQQQHSKKEEKDSENFYDENLPEIINKSKIVKKFKVSFNQSNDMVELVDRETGAIIETISPKDLITLVSKSKTASGILVDRTI